MFGFFSKEEKEKEQKEKEKIEEVKKWFLPLTVFRKPQGINSDTLEKFYKDSEARVNNHLESLYRFGNEKVKSWTKIFVDCIDDIGESYNTIDDRRKLGDYKEKFMNVCINKFKDEKKIHDSEQNQQVILDSEQQQQQVEERLNGMNKKDFVLLFAEIMPKLIEARDKKFKIAMNELYRQLDRQRQEQKINQDTIRKQQDANSRYTKPKTDSGVGQGSKHGEYMAEWYKTNDYTVRAGSKKKSYKRAMRRTRHSRHSRRTRRSRGSRRNDSRKYKKYNKR
jgi:hypothetical protein